MLCQVSLKLAPRFQRRCGLKVNVDRQRMEDGAQPLYQLTRSLCDPGEQINTEQLL